MGRLVVLIVLVVLAVWLLRRALRRPRKENPGEDILKRIDGDLVRCARCGVHLPRSEARQTGGLLFCSDEHARLGRG